MLAHYGDTMPTLDDLARYEVEKKINKARRMAQKHDERGMPMAARLARQIAAQLEETIR